MTRRVALGYSDRPDGRVAAELATAEACAAIGREAVRTVLLFAAGPHTVDAEAVAIGARAQVPDALIAVSGGPSVLLESGEYGSGVVALASTDAFVAALGSAGVSDLACIGARLSHRRARPVLLFGQRTISPSALGPFVGAVGSCHIAGGGVDPSVELALLEPRAEPQVGTLLGLASTSGLRLATAHTAAVRPISGLHRIDEVASGFVSSIDGLAPLERLGRAVRDRHDRPLVLVAIHREHGPPVIRGIGGIDPHRGALHVGDDVEVGDRFAFCVPQPEEARDDLDAALRSLLGSLSGGVPVLAFYFDSVGRGAHLFGAPNVDVRLLRERLGEVPFVGLRLASQIVACNGDVRLAGHSGALALLYAPS